MTFHPDHTFSPADAALLMNAGYCVGYDLDGKPERAMAVHPETGMIIRTFFNGCSIWHPSLNRTDEKVGTSMERILSRSGDLKRINSYSVWRNRSSCWRRLAPLREIAAAGKSEKSSR